jgi:hypothetical protein
MILPVVFVLVVVSVPMFGGRLSRIADIPVRALWAVVSAMVLQIVILNVVERVLPHTIGSLLHVASYALAGWFVVANLRVAGLWIVTLGGVLNLLAIATNGGVMPASPAAARAGRCPTA